MNDQALPPPPETAPPEPRLPFEDSGQPFASGLFDTVKLFITDPTTAFRRMSLTAEVFRPLIYGVLLGWVGNLAAYLFGLMFQMSIFGMLSQMGGMEEVVPSAFLGLGAGLIGLIVLIIAPVFIAIGIFISSLIVHLFLMMVGGDNSGFGATFRVLCYSNTSQLAQLVPIAGGIIAWIWSLILAIIGLTEAQRTTTGKAAAAVLLPILACCVCMVTVFLIAIAFGISAGNWN
jgi:hypothetical protein